MGRVFNVSQRKAPYAQIAFKQSAYLAANQAAVATTAALATTYTGLVVLNPSTNTKKFALLEFGWSQTVAGSADGAVGIMGGATSAAMNASAAAAITPKNLYLGGAASTAVVDNDCTIATPTLFATYGSLGTVAVTGYGSQGPNIVEIGGKIVIPPGYFVAAYCTKATTASLIFHMMWDEI